MGRGIRKTVLGLAVLGMTGWLAVSTPSGADLLEVAPNFTLKDLQGNRVDLSDFAGKVVLLEFWATWCAECTEESRLVKDLYEKYREQGLIVLGVSLDEADTKVIQTYVQKNRIPYPILVGEARSLGGYHINPLPAYYLIDQRGTIRYKIVGLEPNMAQGFEREIQALLTPSGPSRLH